MVRDDAFFGGRPCCGISARLIEPVPTSADADRWRFAVSDGQLQGEIETELPRSAVLAPSVEDLELAVESLAGRFAVEHRLAEMLAESDFHGAFAVYTDDAGLHAHRPNRLRIPLGPSS